MFTLLPLKKTRVRVAVGELGKGVGRLGKGN